MLTLLRYLSVRDLASHPFRVTAFVVAIAFGVALVTAMRVATDSVVRNFNAQFEKLAGSADAQITFGTGESGFSEDVLQVVDGQPQVKRAIAVVRGLLQTDDPYLDHLELFGMDLIDKDVMALYGVRIMERTPDDLKIVKDPFGVFLTDRVAARWKVKVGDRVPLMSPTGRHEHTVHGIFSGEGLAEAFDGRLAVMYLPAAQAVLGLWNEGEASIVDQIDVVLKEGIDVSEGIGALSRVLPEELVVTEPQQRRLANEHLVAGLRATLIGISVFALLAAMFIVYSTSVALVTYRTPVLGTLVVAGASPNGLFKVVLVEAAVLGLLGGALGTALGLVMARFAVQDAAVGLSLNYSIAFSGDAQVIALGRELMVLPFLGSLAAMLSSYAPAQRLRRLDPLELQHASLADERDRFPIMPVAFLSATLILLGLIGLFVGSRNVSPMVCSTGMALLTVGVLLVTLQIVRLTWRAMGAVVHSASRTIAWVSVEQINRNAERSLVTVAAIALSVAVVLAAATLPRSFRRSVAHWYAFYGDVVVAARAQQGGWLQAPVSGSYEERLNDLPEVARVETLRVIQGQTYQGDRIAVTAMTRGYLERALAHASSAVPDPAAVFRGEAVAISENLAVHYGLGLGRAITLETPTGQIELPIAAIVRDFVSDRGSVLLTRELARARWRDSLVNYYAVFLQPGRSEERFRTSFRTALGEDAAIFSIFSVTVLIGRIDDTIAAAFADIDALQLLIIAITVAGIVDLVVSNVIDRRKFYAMLRIVGMTDRGIRRLVAFEGGIIGLSAGVAGVIVGGLTAWTWIHVTYPALVGYVLRLSFAWNTAVLCITAASTTAVFTGAIVARLQLRESPADAIRAE